MNIAIFKPGQTPQYLTSVDPTPYMVDPNALEGNIASKDSNVLFNPDVSNVKNVPVKYWKRSGNTIVEMTQAEKDALTASELLSRKNNADTFSVNTNELFTALIKVINIRLPLGQKITKQELIDAVKEEIR